MVTISMPPLYLFPFSVPCTGDQNLSQDFKTFSNLCILQQVQPSWKWGEPNLCGRPLLLPHRDGLLHRHQQKGLHIPHQELKVSFWNYLGPTVYLIVCFMSKWKSSQSWSPIHIVTLCSLRLRPDQREQLVSNSMVHKTVLVFCISRV